MCIRDRCHTDKSVRAILGDMQRLWGKRYDEDAMRALYPDLDANAIGATLEHGKPHEQAVALAKLGAMGERARPWLPLVEQATHHEYPLVAGYAERALERLAR